MDILNDSAAEALRTRRLLWALILVALAVRLVTLAAYPLMDNTEARYAEIARKMVETGDWLMPQFKYGVPFWSKPPLAIWVTAASFAAFGISEFAARLPALLCCVAIAALAWRFSRAVQGDDIAVKALAVLTTTALFFVAAGAVMTDAELVVGTTMTMVGFFEAVRIEGRRGRLWGYAAFVGLAIGLLGKGPVAIVLAGVPIAAWTAWRREFATVWRRVPWISGTLLCALITVPWYLLAEARTPGFIDYFLVGEHWRRYTQSGWAGDMFGTAHATPRGTIWGLALLCTLPWCAVWAVLAWTRRRHGEPAAPDRDRGALRFYLWLWMLTPAVFFTFAGNILFTYVLPGLPAFAMLVAHAWNGLRETTPWRRSLKYHPLIIPVGACLAVLLVMPRLVPHYSQRDLVAHYVSHRAGGDALVYYREAPHSAEFYTQGKVAVAQTEADIDARLAAPRRDFFVVKTSQLAELPGLRSATVEVARMGRYVLLAKR